MVKIKKERLIITPRDIKPSSKNLEVLGVTNPGAIRTSDKNIVLYVRVIERLIKDEDEKYCYSPRMVGKDKFKIKIDKFSKKDITHISDVDFVFKNETKRLKFISHLRKVILDKTGFKVISIDEKPSFYGLEWDGELGIEDSRITKINDLYIMTYVSLSREENISTSYAISNDCTSWYRRGIIFGQQDKDVVIFPEIINGRYIAFDRPEGNFRFSPPHIWIAYSKDLESWGDLKSINLKNKEELDFLRNGAGPPPIKTKQGWLLLYHSVSEKIKKQQHSLVEELKYKEKKQIKISVYSVGAALFDLKNPGKLLKIKSSIIAPSKNYEKESFEGKSVVFPTGIVIDENQKDVLVFSGAADIYTTVKKLSIKDILNSLRKP